MARIIINRILSFFSIIVATIILALSCTKDDKKDDLVFRYDFSKEGGVQLYNSDVEGETISINIDGVFSPPSEFYFDYSDPNESQWCVELDWVKVYFTPYKKEWCVIVAEINNTGHKRTSTITGHDTFGKKTTIIVSQAG